jgi:hypothetical protein
VPALLALSAIVAMAGWGGSADPPVERIQGIYLQQAIELATVGDRPVRLTRMTRFERCRTRRPIAEDLNEHVVEVFGLDVPGLGFVAGIVNATEGCEPHAAGQPRDPGRR